MRDFFQQTIIKKILRYVLYGFLALVMQNMLLTQLRIGGICPMVLPAAVAAVGMFEGLEFGVFFGLIVGIFADMAFVENTILFTILFPTIGFFSAFVSKYFINKRFVAFMVLALAASIVTAILQMIVVLIGDTWSAEYLKTAFYQIVISIPFSALAFPLPDAWNR